MLILFDGMKETAFSTLWTAGVCCIRAPHNWEAINGCLLQVNKLFKLLVKTQARLK